MAVARSTGAFIGTSESSGTTIANNATSGTLHWAFASGNEYFNYLAAGEQLVLTYTVRATDSSSGTDNRTGDYAVTLTITGSDPFASFDGSLSCSTLTGSTRDAQANAQFHAVPCP